MKIKRVRKTYFIDGIGECVEAFSYEVLRWQANEKEVKFILEDSAGKELGSMTLKNDQLYNVAHKGEELQKSKIGGPDYYLWAFRWHPDDPNQLNLGI